MRKIKSTKLSNKTSDRNYWKELFYEMRTIAYKALEAGDEYAGGESETINHLYKEYDELQARQTMIAALDRPDETKIKQPFKGRCHVCGKTAIRPYSNIKKTFEKSGRFYCSKECGKIGAKKS